MNDTSKTKQFLNDLVDIDRYYLPRILLFAFIIAISPMVMITELEDGFDGMGLEYILIIPLALIGALVTGIFLGLCFLGLGFLLHKYISWTFNVYD